MKPEGQAVDESTLLEQMLLVHTYEEAITAGGAAHLLARGADPGHLLAEDQARQQATLGSLTTKTREAKQAG